MKILVALKQVPARDSLLKIGADARWLDESDLNFEVNEPDAYALEAALQLKEQHGGEVVVVCAGPERASSSIREALAKGADRAIHIEEDNTGAYDVLSLARLLARAVAAEQPDLVLTGLQSDDLGSGQTGVVMAELLNLPHATLIMAVEVTAGGLRVKRELEGGWFQHVSMPLPAVLTIQSGINKLRYATLMGIKRAKTKEVKRVTAAELGVGPAESVSLRKVYQPVRSKQTCMLQGSAAEQAAQLVEKLKFEVRAL
jgi:electron transfer flavoprotein beta subunit